MRYRRIFLVFFEYIGMFVLKNVKSNKIFGIYFFLVFFELTDMYKVNKFF